MSVLVASLVSNASKWIDRFFLSLEQLNYPRDKLHFAFLEGGSSDDTWDKLVKFKDSHQNVWLKKARLKSNVRIKKLAALRNKLIDEILQDEKYVFSVDSDIVDLPPETLTLLIESYGDIVAPYVLIEGKTQFYDTLAFIHKGKNFSHEPPYCPVSHVLTYQNKAQIDHVNNIISGLRKELKMLDATERWSEKGQARALDYLRKFNFFEFEQYVKTKNIFEVDSVGTCYLVNRKVYDANVRYAGGVSEQVSFCGNARRKGFKVWVNPKVTVLHVDLPAHGEKWH